MTPNKACPVVSRFTEGGLQLLAFEHPLAGLQLVKGSIEPGETVVQAALRELAEESGITVAVPGRSLGLWTSGFQGQVWSFVECIPAAPLAESWIHHAEDDGGHAFRFFWHPLHSPASPAQWHPLFRNALRFLQQALATV